MVVAVEASETSLTLSNPVALFSARDSPLRSGNHYDISADGARFVMTQTGVAQEAEEDAAPPTVVVVENWFAEFKDRQ